MEGYFKSSIYPRLCLGIILILLIFEFTNYRSDSPPQHLEQMRVVHGVITHQQVGTTPYFTIRNEQGERSKYTYRWNYTRERKNRIKAAIKEKSPVSLWVSMTEPANQSLKQVKIEEEVLFAYDYAKEMSLYQKRQARSNPFSFFVALCFGYLIYGYYKYRRSLEEYHLSESSYTDKVVLNNHSTFKMRFSTIITLSFLSFFIFFLYCLLSYTFGFFISSLLLCAFFLLFYRLHKKGHFTRTVVEHWDVENKRIVINKIVFWRVKRTTRDIGQFDRVECVSVPGYKSFTSYKIFLLSNNEKILLLQTVDKAYALNKAGEIKNSIEENIDWHNCIS